MGIVLMGFGRAKGTGEKSDDAVGHCEGGELAAGQDKVAYCKDVGRDLSCDAFVNSLIVTADEDDVVGLRQFFGMALGEEFAGRIGKDDFCLGGRGARLDGSINEGGHHDHSWTASEG